MGYTAGWITVPGKGKRWRTAEGEYLMQRPAGSQPGILQAIDRALGGWLPGGGTGNPLSTPARRAVQALGDPTNAALRNAPVSQPKPAARPYQRIPGATPNTPAVDAKGNLTEAGRAVLSQLGINPSIVTNIRQTNPLAIAASALIPEYRNRAHANPIENEIFMPNSPSNRLAVLAHEAAHLDRSRSPAPLEGILGRVPTGIALGLRDATGGDFSPVAGLLAPLRIAGGFLTAKSDAREEDYAEAFTREAMQGMTGTPINAGGQTITPGTPSRYSRDLYKMGMAGVREGLIDLLVPAPAKKTARDLLINAAEKPSTPVGPPAPSFNARQLAIGPKLLEAEYNLLMEQQKNPNSPSTAQLARVVAQLRKDMTEAGR